MPTSHEGRNTKCLSFQQPFATLISLGVKTVECRSKRINVPVRDLVVCASKTARYRPPSPGLPYGYAVGMVDVVRCEDFTREHNEAALMAGDPYPGDHAWVLENPRMIKPLPVHATAGFFYVAEVPEVIPATPEAYQQWVLPVAEDFVVPTHNVETGEPMEDFGPEEVARVLFGNRRAIWNLWGFEEG